MAQLSTTQLIAKQKTSQPVQTQQSSRKEILTEITGVAREGIFFSPEGIFMMSLAVLVDIVELFIPLEPIDPIDIFAFLFFGGWMLVRSGSLRVSKRTATKIGKLAKWAKRLKWLRPVLFIGEMLPLVGNAPLWTIVVYLELKHG